MKTINTLPAQKHIDHIDLIVRCRDANPGLLERFRRHVIGRRRG